MDCGHDKPFEMKYRWSVASPNPLLTPPLERDRADSRLLAICLENRGQTDAGAMERFLEPRLRQLEDPFLLPDMDRAVDRLFQARARGEHVVIFGDYDVDGVSSTALIHEALTALGWKARCYLPHRFDEGYGLSIPAAEKCLRENSATLVLAVDCGSTAVECVRWLRDAGTEVIVLDHHQISDPPPDVVALVNPQRGSAIDFRELCSVGLTFKLAHALVKQGRERGIPGFDAYDIRPLLDLVALGTVADLVPLVRENRILVQSGLERLSETQRPGLLALMEVAGTRKCPGTYEIGFQLGPRLNAAGRLESAMEALGLLQTHDTESARRIAQVLDSRNRERQQIEKSMADEAIGTVRSRFDSTRDFALVEGRLLWHIGVVGIVASRVVREFHRPTLIVGGEGDEWRGSGRSIPGFDLAAALRECSDLLIRYGGHSMAAGITIRPENLDPLRDRLNRMARQQLTDDQLRPELRLDAEVQLAELTLEALEELERLGPHGQGNPEVQVAISGVRVIGSPRRMGREKQHARLRLTDGRHTMDCLWWNARLESLPTGSFDIAVAPSINEFNGKRTAELKWLDWRPTR